MSAALKYVFVAVAVICYMQAAEMARLPRDSGDAPALPANFLENLANPEFWNTLSKNLTSALSEDNLKQLGIQPELIKGGLNDVANELQKNLAELTKTFQQGVAAQQAANTPQTTRK